MSVNEVPGYTQARKGHVPHRCAACVILIVLLLLGAFLYTYNTFQSFSNDDEGGYAYAAWRISEGEVPYRDFLTPQMPVFLYWGGFIVSLFGRSFIALRVSASLTALLAAYFLYLLNRELYGPPAGELAVSLFLIEQNVFSVVRFFRPEAYMLLFQLSALYVFVLGEKRGQCRYLMLAGVLFAAAILSKGFGLLPLAGCYLYLLYAWRRERRRFGEVFREALALGLPVLVIVGTVTAVFMSITPYFLTAVIGHHLMQGAQLTLLQRVIKALFFFRDSTVGQVGVVLLLSLGAIATIWPRVASRSNSLRSLPVWQLPTVLSFMWLSRPLYPRHLVYLVPSVTTLVGGALLLLFKGEQSLWRPWGGHSAMSRSARWVGMALIAVFSLVCAHPWINADDNLSQQAPDPTPLRAAALMRAMTRPQDVVMCDFPGLNFLAGRETTYWASGISRGAVKSGQIQATTLIAEMKRQQVAMVVLDTTNWGRFVNLQDYEMFQNYVQRHYVLVNNVDHAGGSHLDIYIRKGIVLPNPAPG